LAGNFVISTEIKTTNRT